MMIKAALLKTRSHLAAQIYHTVQHLKKLVQKMVWGLDVELSGTETVIPLIKLNCCFEVIFLMADSTMSLPSPRGSDLLMFNLIPSVHPEQFSYIWDFGRRVEPGQY